MRLVSWAALALLFAGHALAQPSDADAIQLDLADCEDVSGATVRELVALEVAPRVVLTADSAATRAQLWCQAGVATIVVAEAGRDTPLQLEITLSDLAEAARPRALALAVAELIATSRLQRQMPAAAMPIAETNAYEPPVASAAARSGVQLWLAVGAARVAQPSLLAPLAALGLVGYWDALAISADFRFEHAQLSQSVAEIQLDAGSLALAPAWRLHASSAELLVGAGVRAGFASLRGSPREPSFLGQSVAGFWLAPCAQVAVHVRLAHRWALRIGVEAAYVTRTLRGVGVNGEAVLELGGLSLAAQLGISWDLVQNE